MTVYFDPKKALEQKQAEQDTITKNEKAKEEIAALIGTIIGLVAKPLLIMLLWNWIVPGMFGLTTLSYLSAAGLYLLVKLFL